MGTSGQGTRLPITTRETRRGRAISPPASLHALQRVVAPCRPRRRSRVIGRGELWWADLGLPRGSAPALRRSVLIVSADHYNRSNLRTVTVVVLTTTTQ